MIDCISMWQPWATWVEKEWKKTETRKHNRLACLAKRERRIAIHASDKWDPEWKKKAEFYLSREQFQETRHAQELDLWPRKALICTVFPWGHGPLGDLASGSALCHCLSSNRLFGLFLKDVQRFNPIPWKGRQGIMKVPDEVIEKEVKR